MILLDTLEIIDKENPQLDLILCLNENEWLKFTVRNEVWYTLFYGHLVIWAILSYGSHYIALSVNVV